MFCWGFVDLGVIVGEELCCEVVFGKVYLYFVVGVIE